MNKLNISDDERKERTRKSVREASRRWRERNPEIAREKARKSSLKYYHENKERVAARVKAQYPSKKEKVSEYNKRYWEKNRTRLLGDMKKWHKQNKKKVLDRNKKRYESDRERLLAEKREYYIANRDRIRAYKKGSREVQRVNEDNRRARKAGATVGESKIIAQWQSRWRSRPTTCCYWCKDVVPSKSAHADHILPLAKGGSHSIENLCVSCGPCNMRKHARTINAWNQQLIHPVLL